MPTPPHAITERTVAALPQLLTALRMLIGADNCNYSRHAMRYEGYFDLARAAYKDATGIDLPHPDGLGREAANGPTNMDILAFIQLARSEIINLDLSNDTEHAYDTLLAQCYAEIARLRGVVAALESTEDIHG